MKPIRLIMSAFGPFASEQVIDFRELGQKTFFLIHGPTGGGKTTILDAMCYSLYGETSGSERMGEQMRSHFADPSTPTCVTFDFAVGENRYRVTRSPEQERPKRRGEGTTTESIKATLWERGGLTNDSDEGRVLATQPSKVTECVETLLGFRCAQFRQVILLPQGKFQKLLMASSAEKEQILQTLFQTEFYALVQESLKEQAKETRRQAELVRDRQTLLLNQASVASLDELRISSNVQRDAAQAMLQTIESLRQAEQVDQETLDRGRREKSKLDERQTARTLLAQVETKSNAIGIDKLTLDAARRAATLAAHETLYEQHKGQETKRREALANAEGSLATAETASKVSMDRLQTLEAKHSETAALRIQVARLEGFREQVARIEKATKEAAAARTTFDTTVEIANAAERERGSSEKELGRITVLHSTAQQTAATLNVAEMSFQQTEKRLADKRLLDSTRTDIGTLEKQYRKDIAIIENARIAITTAKATFSDIQRAYIEGHAARLAQKLTAGEPCSVCGSREHPSPARSQGTLPSDEDIKQRQDDIDKQEEEARKRAETVQRVAIDLAGKRASEDALINALGQAANENAAIIASQVKMAKEKVQNAKAALDQVNALEKQIASTSETLQHRIKEYERLFKERQAAADRATATRATLNECARGVPEDLRSTNALDAAHRLTTGLLLAKEQAVVNARKALELATTNRATALEARSKSADEVKTAAVATVKSGEVLATHLEKAGFSSQNEYDAAKLPDDRIRELEGHISTHEKSLSSAKDRVTRAVAEADGLAVPDLEALAAAVTKGKQELENALTQGAKADAKVQQMDKWISELEECAVSLTTLEAAYSIVGTVADVATGRNSAGLTFQRFVLAFFLDDVLVAATTRLKLMSNGRYHLQRRRDRSDQRYHGGLDLEVFDAYSGACRAVETLSGGESFLASMSLALGLADVVQAHAGGIRMETIFIDEGFGSLDQESLDLAIRSLLDLLKGGRLVGIISHVPELRERFDARLQITSGRRGSSASFALGDVVV